MFRFAQHDTRLILLIATQSLDGEGKARIGVIRYPFFYTHRKILRARTLRWSASILEER